MFLKCEQKVYRGFVLGVGFWLMHITHYAGLFWLYATAFISGVSIVWLFIYSIKTIKENEKFLGEVYLLTSLAMILSYLGNIVYVIFMGRFP
ncbi:hypothetical protein D6829_01145 [Candidatus Pacearchaeota archaeon]|nr:MAG: hypothetical protein D6829_01145 [Candidatus Pacearchaeota archaeon]